LSTPIARNLEQRWGEPDAKAQSEIEIAKIITDALIEKKTMEDETQADCRAGRCG
jgi:hypothetical protein